jgi:hypothetical protein
MDRGLQRLTRSMGEAAHGAKTQAAAFSTLGIELRDTNGRLKTAGEIMPDIAAKIAAIPDAASRAAILVRLFGRAGQQFLPLFEQGASGIEQFTREAKEMGLVLSDDAIQAADATADKIAQLNTALQARIAGAVSQNAGAILNLADAITTLTGRIVQFWGSNPREAMAIMGAIAGGLVAGRLGPQAAVAGAAAGGLAGFLNTGRSHQGQIAHVRRLKEQFDRARARNQNPGQLRSMRANLVRETQVLQDMNRMRTMPSVPDAPALDLGDFAGGDSSSRSRGGGDDAERRRKDALRDEHQYQSDLRRFQLEQLRLQQGMRDDYQLRYDIGRDIAAVERDQYEADLRLAVQLGDMAEARAQRLLAEYDATARTQREADDIDVRAATMREIAEIAEARFDAEAEGLQQEADLARTASERRAAEMRLLDLTYRHQRAKLEAILADETIERATRERAALELQNLDRWRAGEAEGIRRGTMGPLEELASRIPQTTAEINEAFENIAANGLQSLEDGIVDVISGAKSLGRAFRDVANQIIADLLRIMVRRAIVGALGNALGAALGGGGAGFTKATGSISDRFSMAALPKFATGGSMVIRGRGGVDTNLLSLNGRGIARVSHGERLTISPKGGGGSRIQVLPSPYFDVVVDGRVQRGAAPLAARAAMAGSADAQGSLHRRARQRFR